MNTKPTTLAILADTHGNLPALQAVLAVLDRMDLSGIIVAGDLTGGPHPNETIRLLQARNATFIRGNTDENILRYVAGEAPLLWRHSKQWCVMRWSLKRLAPDGLRFLQGLPAQRVVKIAGTSPLHVVHGSLRSSSEGLYPHQYPERLGAALLALDQQVLVCGHTHIPWHLRRDGKMLLNPGSVSASRNGDPRAHFALLNWRKGRWQVEQRVAGYDHALIRRDYQESGLLQEGGELARIFLLSIETGCDVAKPFFHQIRWLLAKRGLTDITVVPDEVWDQAANTFDWEAWEGPPAGRRMLEPVSLDGKNESR